jgi:hypothetical protein
MLHTFFQIRLLMGLVPFLGAILWWGIDSRDKYYEKSPYDVRASLAAAHVPTHILGQYVKGSRVTTPDDETVVTALIDENGTELMRFVTSVRPDGAGSQVDTEVLAPEGAHAARAAEVMKKQAFTMALMQKLADEHVAASIEGRPFDILAFNPMAKGVAEAAGYGDTFAQANADGAEFAKMEQELAEEARQRRNDVPMGEPIPDALPGDDWGN